MESNKQLEFAFRMVNYANAAYQGRYAQLMILSQTQHPKFKAPLVEETKKVLARFPELYDAVWDGKFQFNSAGVPASQPALDTKNLLFSIKPELNSLASEAKRILLARDFYVSSDDVSMLIALFGRIVYSQENYCKGAVDYGKRLDDQMIVELAGSRVRGLQQSIQRVSEFLKSHREKDAGSQFYNHLRFEARMLSGSFRGNLHDINQFEAGPFGTLGYNAAGFLGVEAKAWSAAGFDAAEAGFWRAYDFGIEDVERWLALGVQDPMVAAEWATAGYDPNQAIGWIHVLFPPLLAIQWGNAGYSPQEAAVLVSQGLSVPQEIPDGQADALIVAGLERWAREDEEMRSSRQDER
jgi:hypothetical protein